MARIAGERRPTIIDVARAAGVSVSTVSRVLRSHSDVKAETRAHIQACIDRLGYRPSPLARAMVAGETKLVALLVSDIANPFYPQLAKSVEKEAKADGYTVVICNTDDRTAETRRYLERLLRQGLDGVIHASVARDEKMLVSLVGDPSRIVFTNRRPRQNSLSYVVSDNLAGAEHLTRHLLSQGHRRIGFIAGPGWASNAVERLDGFRRATGRATEAEPSVASGAFSAEHGAQAARDWMTGPRPPTAIIAVNDSLALGAHEALTELGLRVPEDVALAGFDGVSLAASSMFNLTTVDQQIDELGRRACRVLMRQLASSGSLPPTHEVLASRLLVRQSTAAPRARRRSAAASRSAAVRQPLGVLSVELIGPTDVEHPGHPVQARG